MCVITAAPHYLQELLIPQSLQQTMITHIVPDQLQGCKGGRDSVSPTAESAHCCTLNPLDSVDFLICWQVGKMMTIHKSQRGQHCKAAIHARINPVILYLSPRIDGSLQHLNAGRMQATIHASIS